MIRINRFGFMAHSEWQLTTHPPTRLVHSRIYSVSWLHGRRRYYITGHRRSRRIPPRQGARWHQVILISNRLLLSSDASHLVKKLVYSPTNLAKPKILLWFFSGFDKKKRSETLQQKKTKKKYLQPRVIRSITAVCKRGTRERAPGVKGRPLYKPSSFPCFISPARYINSDILLTIQDDFCLTLFSNVRNIEYPWLMTFWPTSWKRQLLYRLQNGYGLLIPRDKSFPTNLNNWHPHHSNVIRLFRAASYWRL